MPTFRTLGIIWIGTMMLLLASGFVSGDFRTLEIAAAGMWGIAIGWKARGE